MSSAIALPAINFVFNNATNPARATWRKGEKDPPRKAGKKE